MWADEAIAGNLYEKIMDALSQTKYYPDLNGNDVLDLIPKGLYASLRTSLATLVADTASTRSHGETSLLLQQQPLPRHLQGPA